MSLRTMIWPWGEVKRLRARINLIEQSREGWRRTALEQIQRWGTTSEELRALKTKLANANRKEIETKRARRIASDPIITASEQNSGSCDELRGDGA